MSKTIKLNKNQLVNLISESTEKIISEMDWKTYANAAKKREQQFRDETDPSNKKKLFNSYYNLRDKARERFDNDYVDDYKYDTFGDKLRGKHSPKFEVGLDITEKPYGLLKGYNKGGDKLFSTKKGTYTSQYKGYQSPRNFFRNKEVADKFTTADDELWDYHNGDYEYDSIKNGGSGKWNKKIKEAIDRTINEISERDSFYEEEDSNGNLGENGQVKSYDIGYYSISQAEEDAKENGYDDVGEYLKYWFNEIQSECPFTWQTLGNGYGFHGTTLFTDGNVVGKLIYDQIMIDELPPM